MVEVIARGRVVDYTAEKESAAQFGQRMKIVRGVPIFYSPSGEPAAESDGVPVEEIARRNYVVCQANVSRVFDK